MKCQKLATIDYWLAGWIFGIIGVTAISILPSVNPPREFDKVLHLISYCLLTVIPIARIRSREVAFLLAGFMPVLGFILEYIQRNISGREFSPEDMIANNVGALIGIFTGILLRLNRRSHRQPREKT